MKNDFRILGILTQGVLAMILAMGATANLGAQDDQPTIAKDWVVLSTVRVSSYRGNSAIWSWKPKINFRVNGPIASGSQLYVEFALPGSKPWLTFDCSTDETAKDYWWNVRECGGQITVPDEKSVTFTGPIEFKIRMRNELHGADATLFAGKAKVGKYHDGNSPGHFTFYVDYDWSIPIGYLLFKEALGGEILGVALAHRGDSYDLSAHAFYQGKEIGKDTCGVMEVESGESKFTWTRHLCEFSVVYRERPSESYFAKDVPLHVVTQNPGDYEIKVLSRGRLRRVLKFTVAPDGKFDNGIATANKLGSNRVIVPVQVIGDQDGLWDKLAWKTGAFFGNPLTGFTAVP